ncbi:hypothetical protein [Kibdelosporangium aridum]|uniref:hypothetical protein n=1 Tax=Kibdelosporangium aridum TaxID=2030 RepID=UPI000A0567F7|nr:hypothetical protein [Kibdelosporangium aridum]
MTNRQVETGRALFALSANRKPFIPVGVLLGFRLVAAFASRADFAQATFTAWAGFEQVTFAGDVSFEQVAFTTPVPEAVLRGEHRRARSLVSGVAAPGTSAVQHGDPGVRPGVVLGVEQMDEDAGVRRRIRNRAGIRFSMSMARNRTVWVTQAVIGCVHGVPRFRCWMDYCFGPHGGAGGFEAALKR